MTFKTLRNNHGSAIIVAIILSTLILSGGVAIMTRNRQQSRVAKKNVNESRALVTAHSYASLLKQEILTNYDRYLTDPSWAPCRKTASVDAVSFLRVLNDPTDAAFVLDTTVCPTVAFTLEYFQKASDASASVPLSALKTSALKAAPDFQVNDFAFEVSLADFNLDSLRNSISSPVLLATTAASDVPVNKNLRLVIDVKRTLASPGPSTCTICRTVPGAVCCGDTVQLSYLETGSGRIMDALWEEESQSVLTQTPNATAGAENPIAISVKNLATSRTDYTHNSFCINSVQGSTSLPYIVDGAIGEGGAKYYLTVHGDIIRNNPPEIVSDPKIVSIGYDNKWFLLRSDGQVMKSNDIADITTYTELPGFVLPTAVALVVGAGPTDVCTP